MRLDRTIVLGGASLALAAGAGAAASVVFGAGSQEPTRTVTISVENGATGATGPAGPPGPAGPAGPEGPAGGLSCITNFSPAILVINSPGGQETLYTCLKDKP